MLEEFGDNYDEDEFDEPILYFYLPVSDGQSVLDAAKEHDVPIHGIKYFRRCLNIDYMIYPIEPFTPWDMNSPWIKYKKKSTIEVISECLEEGLKACPECLEYKAKDAMQILFGTHPFREQMTSIAKDLGPEECALFRNQIGLFENDAYLKAMILFLCELSDAFRNVEKSTGIAYGETTQTLDSTSGEWLKQTFMPWLKSQKPDAEKASLWKTKRESTSPAERILYQLTRNVELLYEGSVCSNDVFMTFQRIRSS